MHCLLASVAAAFSFLSLWKHTARTFSKLICLFRLQSFFRPPPCVLVVLLLLFFSQSLNTQSKMCGIFMRVYDCLSVCVWFQHIRAHQRANQHITSSCRNFEEIDFCRLILSKVEIDCVILLARRLLMYLVQQWTNRNAIQIRTKRKRNKTKQNISLAHLTIFIHDMDVFA